MNSALSFCLRHTLYTVNSGFVLHGSVYIFTTHIHYNFFVTTCSTMSKIYQFCAPFFTFAITRIHSIEISSKNTGFITTGTGTNFYNCIFRIFRVFRNQKYFNDFFHLRFLGDGLIQFHTSHLFHLSIILICKNVVRFVDVIANRFISFIYTYNFLKIFILFIQLYITLHIGNYFRFYDLLSNIIETKFNHC